MILDWLTIDMIHLLMQGITLTVWLAIGSSLLALGIGVGVGALRLSEQRVLRWLATAYVEIHRNIPALVLIIFWAFAFPGLFPPDVRRDLFFSNRWLDLLGEFSGLSIPYYMLAAAGALTMNTSAYLAELFRAGVGTVASQHIDAARTLGASKRVVFIQILTPLGFRAAFPAISTRLIHNLKNTALAAFVSTPEFFHGTQTAITRSFRAVEFLSLAALVYLGLSFLSAGILRKVEQRLDHRPVAREMHTSRMVESRG